MNNLVISAYGLKIMASNKLILYTSLGEQLFCVL